MVRIIFLLTVMVLIALPVQAKPYKAKKNKAAKDTVLEQSQYEAREKFSPAERNLIRAHLLGQQNNLSQREHKNLPPGLQKKVARGKALPPGWQKKVSPGQSLDYQIYRQGESLPDILLRKTATTTGGLGNPPGRRSDHTSEFSDQNHIGCL